MTEKTACDNPDFVEDLARDVAAKSNGQPNITWYKVIVENDESIHDHNACAMIESA